MAILRRTRSAKLPEENTAACKEASAAGRAAVPKLSQVDKWREARDQFSRLGVSEESFLKSPKYFSDKLKGAGVRPRKKKVLGDITYGEVEEAIWSSQGSIGAVARSLRISVYHVQSIFKRFKLLEQEFIEFKESLLDEVEDCLLTRIRMGDTIAMMFYLKCQGKQRGFVERADAAPSKRGVKMKIVRAGAKKDVKKAPVLAFSKAENE